MPQKHDDLEQNNKQEKPKKKTDRSDTLTLDKRVDAVIDWYLEGCSFTEIITKVCEEYNVTSRTAATYHKKAKAKIKKYTTGKLEERLQWHIAARLSLYNKLKDKNTASAASVANNILDKLAELEGLKASRQGDKPNDAPKAHDEVIVTTLVMK